MTLRAQMDELTRRSSERLPPDLHRAVEGMLHDLAAREIAPGSLKIGDAFPDFELPDADGHLVSLDELLADGPLVLSFFRGDWCPFCTAELLAYQQVLPQIREAGASLVAATPDTRGALVSSKHGLGLGYHVLCDIDHGLSLACGILFRVPDPVRRLYLDVGIDLAGRHGNSGCFLPFPATYIVDRAGVIRHAEVDPDFRRRLEPSQVVEMLHGLAAS